MKGFRARLVLKVHGDRVSGNGHKLEHGEVSGTFMLDREGNQALELVTERGYGISTLGDAQTAIVPIDLGPALSRELNSVTCRSPFLLKLFYDFMCHIY